MWWLTSFNDRNSIIEFLLILKLAGNISNSENARI